MSLPTSLTLLIAGVAANIPFLNERLFACVLLPQWAIKHGRKPGYVRVFEWVLAYFLVGSVARALESHSGQIMSQGWEFYVVTACVFGVLAFPGFIFCYLVKRPKNTRLTKLSKK